MFTKRAIEKKNCYQEHLIIKGVISNNVIHNIIFLSILLVCVSPKCGWKMNECCYLFSTKCDTHFQMEKQRISSRMWIMWVIFAYFLLESFISVVKWNDFCHSLLTVSLFSFRHLYTIHASLANFFCCFGNRNLLNHSRTYRFFFLFLVVRWVDASFC